MVHLYNISIHFIRFLFWVASFFNSKAALFTQGRKDIFKKIKSSLLENTSQILWVHCASLGEFEQARPVIEKLKSEFRSYKILLTFFSPSGFEVRKNYDQADYIFYLPWDTHKNATRFMNEVKPAMAIS